MITKTAENFLKEVGSDIAHPLNAAFNTYSVASGMQSVGGALGMSTGGIAASKGYDRLAKKYIIPGIERMSKRVPGRFGKILNGSASIANGIGRVATPLIGGAVGSEIAGKYAPIYKRPNVLG